MQGQPGVVKCLDACRADGVACTIAQDCCSLGCFNGKCGGGLCVTIGEACTANAECCSDICDPVDKKCVVDQPNSRCRPTGESCSSGPQSGCCGATKDNDLCVDGRCGLPPGACHGTNAVCKVDADCCSKHCDPGTHTCTTPCVPAAGACTTGADCCTSSCTNGKCDAPLPPPPPGLDAGGTATDAGAPICKPIGTSCTTGSECCTQLCLGGFCDKPPA